MHKLAHIEGEAITAEVAHQEDLCFVLSTLSTVSLKESNSFIDRSTKGQPDRHQTAPTVYSKGPESDRDPGSLGREVRFHWVGYHCGCPGDWEEDK